MAKGLWLTADEWAAREGFQKGFLLGYHFQQSGRHRRAWQGRHSRICLRATAPPSLFLWELPRGQWGRSQPLISGVFQGFWQQFGCTGGEFVVETKLGAGQCLASPLLDVCWGWRENASSNAAAQWPQRVWPHGESEMGRQHPIRHLGARAQPLPVVTCICASVPAHALLPIHPRHHCRVKKRHRV